MDTILFGWFAILIAQCGLAFVFARMWQRKEHLAAIIFLVLYMTATGVVLDELNKISAR